MLGEVSDMFYNGHQEDAHEFLTVAMDMDVAPRICSPDVVPFGRTIDVRVAELRWAENHRGGINTRANRNAMFNPGTVIATQCIDDISARRD
jgi:hypothetical protein